MHESTPTTPIATNTAARLLLPRLQQHGRVSVPPAERAPLAVRLLRAAELRGDVPAVRALRQQGKPTDHQSEGKERTEKRSFLRVFVFLHPRHQAFLFGIHYVRYMYD